MVTAVLIEDHDVVRHGIKSILQRYNINVIGEARDGKTGIQQVRKLQPDVILLDFKLPDISGLEVIRRLMQFDSSLHIVVLSAIESLYYPMRVLGAGALSFVSKTAPTAELLTAIRKAAVGQGYINEQLAKDLALAEKAMPENKNPFYELSDREMEVALLVVAGKTTSDISDVLCIAEKTVNTYRYRMFAKLGIKSNVQLTRLAMRHHLIEVD